MTEKIFQSIIFSTHLMLFYINSYVNSINAISIKNISTYKLVDLFGNCLSINI
jgi:hypothetical protein